MYFFSLALIIKKNNKKQLAFTDREEITTTTSEKSTFAESIQKIAKAIIIKKGLL